MPQAKVWTGAVSKAGGTVEGALFATYTPTEPEHLVPKSYVDAQGDAIVSSVTGAVGMQVTAAQTAAQSAQNAATDATNAASGAANAATTAINGQKGTANGIVGISAGGHLMLGGQSFFGVQDGNLILVIDLPTTAPTIAGVWWNNGGYICVSARS